MVISFAAMAFGKKRRATSAGNAKKRPAGNSAMCNVVAAELGKAATLTQSCRSMLAKSAKDSLTIYAAERHPYQIQAVAMVGETLAGVQAKLEDDIVKAQATVDSADKERASRINAEATSKIAFAGLEDAVKNAKATLDADTAAEKAAKAEHVAAKDAGDKKDAEMASLKDLRERLTTCKDTYEPCKTSKVDSKRTLGALTKCLADAGLEDGLAESLSCTLKKEVAARGTYDGIVFKEVDAFMVQKVAELEASISGWHAEKEKIVSQLEAAAAAFQASEEKCKASHAALMEAEAAKKDGKTAHSVAASSVASFESDMRKASKSLEAANTALVAFQEGPKKCFEALKNLAPPPEPEPEAPEEPKEAEVSAPAATV